MSWDVLDRLVDSRVFPGRVSALYLWGPPGVGKSTWARRRFGEDSTEIVPINEGTDQCALLGALLPTTGQGGIVVHWVDGPGATCVRRGKVLILDEIDHAPSEIIPILHAMTETDPSQIRVRCADGTYIRAAKGFGVVATSNNPPDALPEALRSRFLSLYVGQPCPDLLETMKSGARDYFASYYTRMDSPAAMTPALTPRIAIMVDAMVSQGFAVDEAVRVALGPCDPSTVDAVALAFSSPC